MPGVLLSRCGPLYSRPVLLAQHQPLKHSTSDQLLTGFHSANKNPLNLAMYPVFSLSYCLFFYAVPKFDYIMGKPFWGWGKQNPLLYSHPLFSLAGCRSPSGWLNLIFPFINPNQPHHLLSHYMFGNSFQEHLLRDGRYLDQPAIPQILFTYSKIGMTFALFWSLETSHKHYDFSKITESGLAMALTLSTHKWNPSGFTDWSRSRSSKCSSSCPPRVSFLCSRCSCCSLSPESSEVWWYQ